MILGHPDICKPCIYLRSNTSQSQVKLRAFRHSALDHITCLHVQFFLCHLNYCLSASMLSILPSLKEHCLHIRRISASLFAPTLGIIEKIWSPHFAERKRKKVTVNGPSRSQIVMRSMSLQPQNPTAARMLGAKPHENVTKENMRRSSRNFKGVTLPNYK